MHHLFVAPHPDDVAFSCGGLIAALRARDEAVTILTVFSGTGAATRLTSYQRAALGFGEEELQPSPRRARRQERDDRRTHDDRPPQVAGRAPDDEPGDADARQAAGLAAIRRDEDERYARFAGVALELLDLPDAIFRGYESDEQLLAAPRPDDRGRSELLLRAIERLAPGRLHLPLGIGDHVDHQLVRDAGLALVARGWAADERAGGAGACEADTRTVALYEDFPYAWRTGFSGSKDLPGAALAALSAGVTLEPEPVDITATIERKIRGLECYATQLERQLGGRDAMASAVRTYGAAVASQVGRSGFAERSWVAVRR